MAKKIVKSAPKKVDLKKKVHRELKTARQGENLLREVLCQALSDAFDSHPDTLGQIADVCIRYMYDLDIIGGEPVATIIDNPDLVKTSKWYNDNYMKGHKEPTKKQPTKKKTVIIKRSPNLDTTPRKKK